MNCHDCPDCAVPLSPLEYEGVTLQTCERCGGEFLAGEEMAHVVRTREARFDAAVHDAVAKREPLTGVPGPELDRDVSCPACEVPMTPINYAHDSGICVDRCPQCSGLWLDADELEKIQALLERQADEAPARIQAIAGDIDKAREQARERTSGAFDASRFAFVNAVINRLLDAA